MLLNCKKLLIKIYQVQNVSVPGVPLTQLPIAPGPLLFTGLIVGHCEYTIIKLNFTFPPKQSKKHHQAPDSPGTMQKHIFKELVHRSYRPVSQDMV